MSRLPLAEPEDLRGFVRDLHDGAPEENWGRRHTARVFAAAPELLQTFLEGFYWQWHTNTGAAAEAAQLSPRLKELVRLRIATLNGCKSCKASRMVPDAVPEELAAAIDNYEAEDGDRYSDAEKAAVRFAELLALDHHSIDDEHIAELRKHFDEGQILELMLMAGQYIGFGRVISVLQLETVACPIPASA